MQAICSIEEPHEKASFPGYRINIREKCIAPELIHLCNIDLTLLSFFQIYKIKVQLDQFLKCSDGL